MANWDLVAITKKIKYKHKYSWINLELVIKIIIKKIDKINIIKNDKIIFY